MLHQFRHLYPQGSIISELINIDRGLYLVKVTVQDRGIILSTGLAGEGTIEKAEDLARERALMTLDLKKTALSSPPKQSEPQQQSRDIPQARTRDSNFRPPTLNETSPSVTTRNSIPAPQTAPEPKATTFTPPTISEEFTPEITPETTTENSAVSESQTNIFDQPISDSPTEETILEEEAVEAVEAVETVETVELDFNIIKHKTDLEMKRLNWTKEQGRDYLLRTYGKIARLHLTDEELLEFWRYLETIPN